MVFRISCKSIGGICNFEGYSKFRFMPVFIDKASIIIEKITVENKYEGGIEQFKADYSFGEGKRHQEDNEIFMIAYMNLYDSNIWELVKCGLDFDKEKQISNDFAILYSHGGESWDVDWLENNGVFAWHKDCEPELIERANEIGNMLMDDITVANERGENLFGVIR